MIEEFRWTGVEERLKQLDYDLCMSTLERSLYGANADWLLNYMYNNESIVKDRFAYSDAPGNRWEEIKSLLDSAFSASGEELQNFYNQVFDIVAEEAFFYPLLRREQVTGFDKNSVSDFRALSTGGMYCLGTELR